MRTKETRRLTIWLLGVTLAVVATGMAFGLGWAEVVQHHPWWLDPADSWGLIRGAHWIDWGGFSYIYSAQRTTVLTLPGFEVLLAPFAALSSALHLTETAPGLIPNVKPSAWLLFGPIFFSTSATVIFAVDALARSLGFTIAKRKLCSVLVAAAMWQVVAMWGHPEDVLALGLALFALNQALRGRWTWVGWLLGAALAMQLYVVALVPLFIGLAGLRRTLLLLARAAVLPGFLFVAVVVPNPHASLHALLNQPAYPSILFPTPWVSLAPKLTRVTVAAGPARLVGFAVASGTGVLAAHRRADHLMILWLATVALTGRFVFEAVVIPYYMSPALVFVVILAVASGRVRTALVVASGSALLHFGYWKTDRWNYWLVMTGLSLLILAVTLPPGIRSPSRSKQVETPQDEARTDMTVTRELLHTVDAPRTLA